MTLMHDIASFIKERGEVSLVKLLAQFPDYSLRQISKAVSNASDRKLCHRTGWEGLASGSGMKGTRCGTYAPGPNPWPVIKVQRKKAAKKAQPGERQERTSPRPSSHWQRQVPSVFHLRKFV